jgi:hypothetical protein
MNIVTEKVSWGLGCSVNIKRGLAMDKINAHSFILSKQVPTPFLACKKKGFILGLE